MEMREFDTEIFDKVMVLAHQIQKKEAQINKLLEKMNKDDEVLSVNGIYFYTEIIPEIHAKYGGDLKAWEVNFGGDPAIDASLKLDGILFRVLQCSIDEKERYGMDLG